MWARLYNGVKVGENVRALLSNSTNPNMFDMHPPFQIDGNFGGGAGIAEAILQSHSGEISFLPALPPEWSEGRVKGLMARGGFELNFKWSDGKVTECEILSKCGNECCIFGENITVSGTSAVKDGIRTVFKTEKGQHYKITFA